jgi:L-ascorbate metabolism protein UlaG (beta-lactamase superfamily)
VNHVRITHIGGPTVLIEVEGLRILSDPTFDPPGKTYKFGWGTSSRKTTGPSIAPSELGPIDVVLISHDNHGDNLDDAGRALLASAGAVVTTSIAASRLGVPAIGLNAWQSNRVEAPARPALEITATPCRHGPPLSRRIVGHVVGFALRWEGQEHGLFWISGDSVLYDGLREVARRLDVDIAVLHLGEVQFPITGPIRYSMTAKEGVELCTVLKPRTAIPVHYEGWSHFHEGRAAVERAIATAPPETRDRFQLLNIGERTEIRA